MDTNAENKNELATPLIFGMAIGTLCAPFGPAITLLGFATGAVLGYWSDKKEEAKNKPQEKTPLESGAKKSICQ